MIKLATPAEEQAARAQELEAFGGINLVHVKRSVVQLLGLIGREGIFDEYTVHDISHIHAMLKSLDWIIPDTTKASMAPADWLLIVLSIYFHDLGMLVTRKEYESRHVSRFPAYRDGVLFEGSHGRDYRAKVAKLPADKRERFLYQEFVREHHAERVRWWVTGKTSEHLGVATEVASEINKLLDQLDPDFRRDLGLVCESHHLDDLNDFKKYRVSQPYGGSDEETANVQYAAILLRTADLLHITKDRTPSVVFRTIDPSDPISQQEWAKQMAVKRIRSKSGSNREGHPDADAPRDTIEVFATFRKADGFFGLTSYLKYAQNQLNKSFEWVQAAQKYQGSRYHFPWRYIDDSNILTEGFLKETFEFKLDQPKILELLTGHTLYNDVTVVLRELVQNALDAIRLQSYASIQASEKTELGGVSITWDSKQRILTVRDNGTGMTQDIIERHLLCVGSSRYQDPEFRKKNPGFSSISRFGIGILSAFMVADAVEITTCHPEQEQARQLSLRSVHGKYLIKLLDKDSEIIQALGAHGTEIKVTVRHSADLPDILETARRWIVIPGCRVDVTIDNQPTQEVGFTSPKEALEHLLAQRGRVVWRDGEPLTDSSVRVDQRAMEGLTLAYALEWSESFREWSFLDISPQDRQYYDEEVDEEQNDDVAPYLGTCVEGIRVEFDTPGYGGKRILALANATGPSAPKTNVARSGLEATLERESMLHLIYSAYIDHVRGEMSNLRMHRSFSLTWATQEAQFLLGPILSGSSSRSRPVNEHVLWKVAFDLGVVLLERGNDREAVSITAIQSEPLVWTIHCAFVNSAELMIREVESAASLRNLVHSLRTTTFAMPDEPIMCGFDPSWELHTAALVDKEIDTIRIEPAHRRVDLRWVMGSESRRWVGLPRDITEFVRQSGLRDVARRRFEGANPVVLPTGPITVIGAESDIAAVQCFRGVYVLPGSPTAQLTLSLLDQYRAGDKELAVTIFFLWEFLHRNIRWYPKLGPADLDVDTVLQDWPAKFQEQLASWMQRSHFKSVVMETNWRLFDPSAWVRSERH